MRDNYALAVPRRARPRTRRHTGLFTLSVLLAAVLIVPALRRGLNAGASGIPHRPVEIIYQNPELPNGCEVTSLAMVLSGAGCPADKLELYRDYLPKADFSQIEDRRYGPNPEKWYAGDAADLKGGWYCFQGPIVQAADRWLKDHASPLRARSLDGLSREELDRYAQSGTPLAVWVTLEYAQPKLSQFTWTLEDGTVYHPYGNLHCVVLAGIQDGQYRVADPIKGFDLVDQDLFWSSFSATGSRAVVVE